jgi:hypothetical protein|tara:strand:+ start:52 stop:192 length:141 start_codon:yes stop_codon:yes gene_type:complete
MSIELIEMLAGFAMGVSSAAMVVRYRASEFSLPRSFFARAAGQEDK